MQTLKQVLYRTVHRNRKRSPEEMADHIGISYSYLCRACLPETEPSGARFPLDYLIPLMHFTGDYSVLEHLEQRSGRSSVRLPRVKQIKGDPIAQVDEIQMRFQHLSVMVRGYYKEPNQDKKGSISEAIHAHVSDMLSMDRAVQTYEQRELDI